MSQTTSLIDVRMIPVGIMNETVEILQRISFEFNLDADVGVDVFRLHLEIRCSYMPPRRSAAADGKPDHVVVDIVSPTAAKGTPDRAVVDIMSPHLYHRHVVVPVVCLVT